MTRYYGEEDGWDDRLSADNTDFPFGAMVNMLARSLEEGEEVSFGQKYELFHKGGVFPAPGTKSLSLDVFGDGAFVNVKFNDDVELDRLTFEDCLFVGGQMDGSSLVECTFSRCVFQDFSLAGSTLFQCSFEHCIFMSCDFDDVTWFSSQMTECALVDCDAKSFDDCDTSTSYSLGLKKLKI